MIALSGHHPRSARLEAAWLLWRWRPGEDSATLIIEGLGLNGQAGWYAHNLVTDEFWDLLLAMNEYATGALPFVKSIESTFPLVEVRAEAHRIIRNLERLASTE